jgi:purine-binding chemotaxis protein CheW
MAVTKTVEQALITFRLGFQTFGLPIEPILQVIPMVTIQPLPGVNHSVEGTINYHGRVIPVFNLRRHLGLPEASFRLDTPIILIQASQGEFGLIVDEIQVVFTPHPEDILEVSEVLKTSLTEKDALQGFIRAANQFIIVLNPDELPDPDSLKTVMEAIEALSTEFNT